MKTDRLAPWAAYCVVGVGALIMLAPFYFMFVFATHSRTEIFSLPPPMFFGDDFLKNLKILTDTVPFWRNLGWSLYVALASTALTLLFCSMGGYAFALFDFRFKNLLFGLVMGTMLLPSFMNMIPTFMIMDALGWIDQPKALYIPGAASAFGIFLMRQFVTSSIPKDLVEAARMDGCSEFGIYARIVLPLLKPALGTLGLITFIASWNNFIGPLIVMRSPDMYTLPLALRSLQSPVNTEWGALMTGSAIATLAAAVAEVIVVTTPEPTSTADAHAALSRLRRLPHPPTLRILVNQARSDTEGREFLLKIKATSREFLGMVVEPFGFVRHDPAVPNAVRSRRPYLIDAPSGPAAKSTRRLAGELVERADHRIRQPAFFATLRARWALEQVARS